MQTKKWPMKLVLILTFLGAIGIIAIIPYEMTVLLQDDLPGALPVPIIVTINSITQLTLLFVLVLIGVRLSERTGLGAPIIKAYVYERRWLPISKTWMKRGITVSFLLSLLVILLDLFLFNPLIDIPNEQIIQTTVWWQGLLAMFYGGITEELMIRLFGMTLIVWLYAKITKKRQQDIPKTVFAMAIFLTALLFGIGHLPAAIGIYGELTGAIILRILLLNGIFGLWFGYLYYKKGLEYAIVSHMSADFFIHVLFAQVILLL